MTPLDRVTEVEPGVRATAIRHVPQTLDVFETHFPKFPVLPGVLILDDLAALAGLAAGDGTWTLASAGRVKYRHFVRPGDVLELAVTVTRRDESTVTCKATAQVDGRAVTTIRELILVCPAEPGAGGLFRSRPATGAGGSVRWSARSCFFWITRL